MECIRSYFHWGFQNKGCIRKKEMKDWQNINEYMWSYLENTLMITGMWGRVTLNVNASVFFRVYLYLMWLLYNVMVEDSTGQVKDRNNWLQNLYSISFWTNTPESYIPVTTSSTMSILLSEILLPFVPYAHFKKHNVRYKSWVDPQIHSKNTYLL